VHIQRIRRFHNVRSASRHPAVQHAEQGPHRFRGVVTAPASEASLPEDLETHGDLDAGNDAFQWGGFGLAGDELDHAHRQPGLGEEHRGKSVGDELVIAES
jgi:hypothetical protein